MRLHGPGAPPIEGDLSLRAAVDLVSGADDRGHGVGGAGELAVGGVLVAVARPDRLDRGGRGVADGRLDVGLVEVLREREGGHSEEQHGNAPKLPGKEVRRKVATRAESQPSWNAELQTKRKQRQSILHLFPLGLHIQAKITYRIVKGRVVLRSLSSS